MIDGHIHFEKQAYSLDVVKSMVQTAIDKGIEKPSTIYGYEKPWKQ